MVTPLTMKEKKKKKQLISQYYYDGCGLVGTLFLW